MASGVFSIRQQAQAAGHGAWSGSQTTPFVEYLVVAGGGGGGDYISGGGGGGGLLQGSLPIIPSSPITVTVGAGGAGNTNSGSLQGAVGGNSVFGSITATGGGGGGGGDGSGGAGGSGGGASYANVNGGGQGTAGQGNRGGGGASNSYGAGGGGGAGTVGGNYVYTLSGGFGGAGIGSTLNGTVTVYAGGGGGGSACARVSSPGGAGGGGSGATPSGSGTAGVQNTGGGGGGGGSCGGTPRGWCGGSGIVIISYPDIYNAPASFGGANSPTASTSGSGSLSLNGSNQYVTYPQNSAFNLGTGAFTVEGWIYITSTPPGNIRMIGLGYGGYGGGVAESGWSFQIQGPLNQINWYRYDGTTETNIGASYSFALNTWYHLVAVRNGSSNFSIFVNGNRVYNNASSTLSYNNVNSDPVYIGYDYDGSTGSRNQYLPGYISNIRVVNGTAVYDPTQSTLIVPTAPLTAIVNTSLLLSTVSPNAFNDSSTNAFTPTAYNSPTWNQLSPFATGLGYKNRVYTWTGSGTVTF